MKNIKQLWVIVDKDDNGNETAIDFFETRDKARRCYLPNHRKIIKFKRIFERK